PPCASFSWRPSSTPHSSPGSSTTSFSREMVLSASRVRLELGSGTCLTVTTIFMALQQLSLRRKRGMEALEVGRSVEAFELRRIEILQPRDVELLRHVVRGVVSRVQRANDRRQSRLAVGAAHGLEQTVVARYGGVTAPRRRDGKLGRGLGDIRHVACDREQNVAV